jgi:hypothetical protein
MPRTTQNLTITEDTSWEKLWANEAGSALRLAKPWAALLLVFLAGLGMHLLWGRPGTVAWPAVGLTLAGVTLTSFTWHVSRLVTTGRAHSAATMAAIAAWLVAALITGPVKGATLYALLVFGGTLALTWNVRGYARRHRDGSSPASQAGKLSEWFANAAKDAGVPGTTLQVKAIEPTRAEAVAVLPPGERVAGDLQNKVKYIESGMQVPPGSLTISEDPDRADHALVTLSDPRVLRSPVRWPGPSLPGQSIAMPLRTGIWQDGVPVQHVLPGQHLKIMGATGAGKSIGGCWGYCGELITRYDAVVLALDLTKGTQTWGPLEEGLHRFEHTRDGVRDLMNSLHKLIPEWTTWLADHGQTRWTEGCGLSYKVVWWEEAPDIYDALSTKEQEWFVSDVRALRSAGGSFVLSLQRADWTQMPTIVRGQLAHMCFGLNDSADERFGLSEIQAERGAAPARWGTRYPGMAYLDAASIPDERLAMPLRTYSWGDDDTAAANMTAHAALYPASARPVDEITAAITGGPRIPAAPPGAAGATAHARPVTTLTGGRDQENEENPMDEHLRTEDPDPGVTADINDPIEGDPDDQAFEFSLDDKPTPAEARAIFADFLDGLRRQGVTEMAPRDFAPIMQPGMLRAWIQARLKELVTQGQLTHDEETGTYRFTSPPKAA